MKREQLLPNAAIRDIVPNALVGGDTQNLSNIQD
jgi:hypothetical protein